jgi:hypothetical protein
MRRSCHFITAFATVELAVTAMRQGAPTSWPFRQSRAGHRAPRREQAELLRANEACAGRCAARSIGQRPVTAS